MRVLHLSHHRGCLADFAEVGRLLGLQVESATFDDGYNIGPERAARAWRRWRGRLNAADVVLVSDTAPLARIVLDHLDAFRGRLVVWVCNRFDYADQATNDCGFPDPDYYELFRAATGHPRVEVVSFTPFEIRYARERGVDLGARVIRPLGSGRHPRVESPVPPRLARRDTVLVPPYHNDELFELDGRLKSAGIGAYRGRYGGPEDAATFKAVVHVPYAWSTFALFEHLHNAMAVFVPSLAMLRDLAKSAGFFFADYREEDLGLAEWYAPAHDFLVRFESWEDLGHRLRTTDFAQVHAATRLAAARHRQATIAAWADLFARVDEGRQGRARTAPPLASRPPERGPESAVTGRLEPFRTYLDAHTAVASGTPSDESARPASRFDSFNFAFCHFAHNRGRRVVELGTIRSFVHGGLPGCNSDDLRWWQPDNPEAWDWGAGCFSLLAAICLGPLQPEIHTVDLDPAHLERCRVVTAPYAPLFTYHARDSADFLRALAPSSVDLVYLDTGDVWPIEPSAAHQLEEARALVEADVLSARGLVLIDDVGNETPRRLGETSPLAKSKYALPYLLDHGFTVVFDGYQVALTPPKMR